MAYELLAKEQPMAVDLRFILSVIKINSDLERIGDQSMGIARRTLDLLAYDNAELPVDVAGMGEGASRMMVRTAVQDSLRQKLQEAADLCGRLLAHLEEIPATSLVSAPTAELSKQRP
ncbi:Phosphate transport system regulatory protein PhoU (plasmid) [Acidisarcina polymorpha]|uniref:Phosphate transport system regulatory protein PhoU n=2 Tax=Acidisarcina polymorpha TaxID=2211140 RepID=A0A2Z5G9X5_9BACT|nr:Phosphate transport system regulatory protein PhoU [Acidisarcina polymorpha]